MMQNICVKCSVLVVVQWNRRVSQALRNVTFVEDPLILLRLFLMKPIVYMEEQATLTCI